MIQSCQVQHFQIAKQRWFSGNETHLKFNSSISYFSEVMLALVQFCYNNVIASLYYVLCKDLSRSFSRTKDKIMFLNLFTPTTCWIISTLKPFLYKCHFGKTAIFNLFESSRCKLPLFIETTAQKYHSLSHGNIVCFTRYMRGINSSLLYYLCNCIILKFRRRARFFIL